MKYPDPVFFRWLGVNGLELKVRNQVLLIDPYLTRIPIRRIFLGTVEPNRKLIAEKIRQCDYLLVTHAHWDHLLDSAEVIRNMGAVALGSPNTCRLLALSGVPENKIREINAGDQLTLGPFHLEVLAAVHLKIPGFSSGQLPPGLKLPLRARDYRMDHYFSFLISTGEWQLLTDPGESPVARQAQVLFVKPFYKNAYYRSLLGSVQPRLVIPVHWDDMFRPLAKPLRSMLKPPAWSLPPLQRTDLVKFSRLIRQISPKTQVLSPEIFKIYDISEILK